MKHRDVKRSLPDYLEGELALEQRALVDAHLAECDACANEVAEMQQTIRLLRSLPEPETPPMIAANVMRRIRTGEADPGLLDRITRAVTGVLEPSFVLPATAVAAAALLVVVLQDSGSGSLASAGGALLEERAEERAATLVPGRGATVGRDRSGSPATGAARMAAEARRPGAIVYTDAFIAPPRPSVVVGDVFATGRSGFAAAPQQTGVRIDRLGAGEVRARTVSQPRGAEVVGPSWAMAGAPPREASSSAGDDARDLWIARALEDPAGFARYLAAQNLAEQELWVSRLSERAESRGLLDELVQALRGSDEASAAWLADDFAAEASGRAEAGQRASAPPAR